MLIQIEIRDTNPQGKRFEGKKCVLSKFNVYRQAGDGLRLNNLATQAASWFKGAAMLFLNDSVNPTTSTKEGTLPSDKRFEQYLKDDEKKEETKP